LLRSEEWDIFLPLQAGQEVLHAGRRDLLAFGSFGISLRFR
jgi:hypothetical protein